MTTMTAAATAAVAALLSIVACVSASRVQLVNNVYTGLVVGVEHTVDVQQCRNLISSLQTLLNEASSQLYLATNQRAFFGDVTVVVPSTWPDNCTGVEPAVQATTESYLTGDLRVTGSPHPVYGSAPWTRQFGLCGQPGAFMQVTEDYVRKTDDLTNRAKGRALVHEWARYRWGVFEETGYRADPLYPSFHRTSADLWRPTVCANTAVAGAVKPVGCVQSSNGCTFEAFHNATNAGVTSSLMGLPALDQVEKFCDSSNHDRSAPTKHNLLCGERSIWEVMAAHEDFRYGNNPPGTSLPPPVNVTVVKLASDRLLFVLESTVTMRRQQRWDFVSSSIRKFVNWDAPTGVQVGIGHFGSEYRTDRNLTTVPDSLMGRGELANLPPIADDVMEDNKSWRAAVDGALAALGEHAAGAVVIWITGNERNSASRPTSADLDYMTQVLQTNRTRLVVIFYPHVTPGLSRVAKASGGSVIVIDDVARDNQTSIGVFHALVDAHVLALDRHASEGYRRMVRVEDKEFVESGEPVRGSFLIDSSLGANTTLVVLFRARTDVGYVRLRPPGGQMAPVYTYPDTTNHLQYAKVGHLHGLWEYEVDRLPGSRGSIVVQVTSEPTAAQPAVRAEAWTNAHLTGTLNATRDALIIYGSLMMGHSPIMDADIHAVVTRPDGRKARIKLLDNGLGVPDVLRGDGVYSRYFTDFGTTSARRRLLRVQVEVGGSRGRLVTSRDPGRCCGSTVGTVDWRAVRALRRSVSAGAVFVTDVTDGDVYPPSRVTDLSAQVDPLRRTATFRWTAPGDDFDGSDGRVSRYEVRFSTVRAQVRDQFSNCSSVSGWSAPEPGGTASLVVITVNTTGRLLFFGLRGVDEAGNVAAVSNLVSVLVPPPPTTPPPAAPAVPATARPAIWSGQVPLIALLSAAGVILLLVLLTLYCCLRRSRRRAKPPPAASARDIHRMAGVDGPATIAYDVEKEKLATAISISDGRTPVMWTASDILQLHGSMLPPHGDTQPQYGGPQQYDQQAHGRHSPCGSASHYASQLPLNAGQLGPGRSRYNSYQTPYGDDMAYDDGSLQSTQPSDSFPSLSSDPRHAANVTPSEERWAGDRDSPGSGHRCSHSADTEPLPAAVRPDTADGAAQLRAAAAAAAFVDGRRRRNVTQV